MLDLDEMVLHAQRFVREHPDAEWSEARVLAFRVEALANWLVSVLPGRMPDLARLAESEDSDADEIAMVRVNEQVYPASDVKLRVLLPPTEDGTLSRDAWVSIKDIVSWEYAKPADEREYRKPGPMYAA